MIILAVIASLVLLVVFLYYFLISPVEKVEPKIITLKEPVKTPKPDSS
jgi:hypothetical protein